MLLFKQTAKILFRTCRSNVNSGGSIHPVGSRVSAWTRAVVGPYSYANQMAGLQTSSLVRAKDFVERENSFAHQTMETHPSYSNTLALSSFVRLDENTCNDEYQSLLARDWSLASASDICRAFRSISISCSESGVSMTEDVFDGLCENLAAKTDDLDDSELADVLSFLRLWPQTESLNSRNFERVWSSLDKQCVARVKRWSVDSLLYFADHWYKLHLARVSNYMWYCIRKVGRKPSRLSPSQLVQSLFYVNVCRKVHGAISMYEYEEYLATCVDKMSLDELAIVAMGFFKSQTKIRNTILLAHMVRRTREEINTVHEITLCALLKFFRYSLPFSLGDMLLNLLDSIVPNVPRLSLLCCVHIALAGTNLQIFHEKLFKVLSQRFSSDITSMRIKDIERVSFALTLFDFDPKTEPCIYKNILEELHNPERGTEFEKYPRCVATCLSYLTMKNIFPSQLINDVLDPQFITKAYGKFHKKIGREILTLDLNVSIDCPSYNGNRLNPKLRKLLAREFVHWTPKENGKKLSTTERMAVEVTQTLQDTLGGPRFIFSGNILPHFQRPDIVFGLKEKLVACDIPTEFKEIPLGEIKKPPVGEHISRWYCVVVGGANNFIKDSERPLGSLLTKIRQLTILGYTPVLIPFFEWNEVPGTQRKKYIREKISLEHYSAIGD